MPSPIIGQPASEEIWELVGAEGRCAGLSWRKLNGRPIANNLQP